MKLTIHRGTHEIGGTCIELESQGSRLILDLGLPLVNQDGSQFILDKKVVTLEEMLSQGTLPNISRLYDGTSDNINLILSHAHQDHYGLMHHIHPAVPIWMTKGTKSLLNVCDVFLPNSKSLETTKELPVWEDVQIGPFTVTAYLADHSAPDAVSLLIEADGKRLFYSGDLRGTGRKKVLFEKLIKNPPHDIDCLLLEGTMMGRDNKKFPTEESVEEELIRLLQEKDNLAFIFCSGQNIDRLVSAYRACLKIGTIFVIDLYTAYVLHSMKSISSKIPQYNWKNVRVKYWHQDTQKLETAGLKQFFFNANHHKIDVQEINEKRKEILMYCRPYLFERITKHLQSINGLMMIWSQWHGYLNDKHPVYKFCKRNDIDLKYIHTSGHAPVKDLEKLSKGMKPKKLIPIHTLEPNRFSETFENVHILQDGDVTHI